MKTDWELVRSLMNAAVDACQKIDELGVESNDYVLTADVNGQSVSVWDFLQSAHSYPEALRYSVIRGRHQMGDDKPFTPDTARILINVAGVCAELIEARELDTPVTGVNPYQPERAQTIRQEVNGLTHWYQGHFAPQITKIMEEK